MRIDERGVATFLHSLITLNVLSDFALEHLSPEKLYFALYRSWIYEHFQEFQFHLDFVSSFILFLYTTIYTQKNKKVKTITCQIWKLWINFDTQVPYSDRRILRHQIALRHPPRVIPLSINAQGRVVPWTTTRTNWSKSRWEKGRGNKFRFWSAFLFEVFATDVSAKRARAAKTRIMSIFRLGRATRYKIHHVPHAATRCNTLTRYNTLQHAATRCNTLQHAATRCNEASILFLL